MIKKVILSAYCYVVLWWCCYDVMQCYDEEGDLIRLRYVVYDSVIQCYNVEGSLTS
jgi:hypothetical protein